MRLPSISIPVVLLLALTMGCSIDYENFSIEDYHHLQSSTLSLFRLRKHPSKDILFAPLGNNLGHILLGGDSTEFEYVSLEFSSYAGSTNKNRNIALGLANAITAALAVGWDDDERSQWVDSKLSKALKEQWVDEMVMRGKTVAIAGSTDQGAVFVLRRCR